MHKVNFNASTFKKRYRALSLLFISFALYTEMVGGIAFSGNKNFDPEDLKRFLTFFPAFLRNFLLISILTLICSIISIVFSNMWDNRTTGVDRVFAKIFMIVGYLMIFLTIFQSL